MTSPKAGQEMALDINPKNEIRFKGPFTRPATAYLYLSNPTEKSIVFKVKTTAPERYQVKPVSYILKAGERKTVTLMLCPLIGKDGTEIGGAFNRARQKFMVQASYVESNDNAIDRILTLAALKGTLMKSTFTCVFEEKAPMLAAIEASRQKSPSNYAERSIRTNASHGQGGMVNSNLDEEEPNTLNLVIFAVILLVVVFLLSNLFGGSRKT